MGRGGEGRGGVRGVGGTGFSMLKVYLRVGVILVADFRHETTKTPCFDTKDYLYFALASSWSTCMYMYAPNEAFLKAPLGSDVNNEKYEIIQSLHYDNTESAILINWL